MNKAFVEFDREDMMTIDYSHASCIHMYDSSHMKYLQLIGDIYEDEELEYFVEQGYTAVFMQYNTAKTQAILNIVLNLDTEYVFKFACKRFTNMINNKEVFEVFAIDIY